MGRRIAILGAGFGGLFTALELERQVRQEAGPEILLLDARNYHLFSPMLHEVTSGSVEPRHVVWPIRALRRKTRCTFERREVRAIDLEARKVVTNRDEIGYDYLVIALGSTTNCYGVKGAEEWAFSFKTLADAVRLRNHVLEMFEQADQDQDPERRRRLLTFVLAEATGRIIPCVSDQLAELGLAKLRGKGIEVRLQAPVVRVGEGEVELTGGDVVSTATIIWTAGGMGDVLD